MKLGIIHFSDIHLITRKDKILTRSNLIAQSIKTQLNEVEHIFIVISGDIVDKGKIELFPVATTLLQDIVSEICSEKKFEVHYIITGGNHDCDFSKADAFRELAINDILKSGKIAKLEYETSAFSVHDDFFKFANRQCDELYPPGHKISTERDFQFNGFTLTFHCYNTSFLSTVSEQPQSLIVPQSAFIQRKEIENQFVVSVFHHNTGWLSTQTEENNKKQFEGHLLQNSDVVMCGHEHQGQRKIVSNLENDNRCIYMEVGALQPAEKSSFELLILDTECKIYKTVDFYYEKYQKIYLPKVSEEKQLHTNNSGLVFSKSHEAYLNRIDVPLTHPYKSGLILDDLFIYPDLEEMTLSPILRIEPDYISSETINKQPYEYRIRIIEGEIQSGKTSLLKRLARDFMHIGIHTIWTTGSDWNEVRDGLFMEVLKNKFKEQFNFNTISFDRYLSNKRSSRAIFIDNINTSPLNSDGIRKLLKKLSYYFEIIIITSTPYWNVNTIDIEDINIGNYKLLNLGHKLRYNLIEKWKMLGLDSNLINIEEKNREIILSHGLINSLLGNHLMPASPIFVLSLLQSLDLSKNGVETKSTGYAYCYNALIMSALLKNGLIESRLQGFMKFLEYLAYKIWKRELGDGYLITPEELESVLIKYKDSYIFKFSVDQIINLLIKANLFKVIDNRYGFRYKYIFYYLIAQRIAKYDITIRNSIVKELCKGIINDQNANILIFLVHHLEDIQLLEYLLQTGKTPFSGKVPLSLDLNDQAFLSISSLLQVVKPKDVIYGDVDYKEHQQASLAQKDTEDRLLKTQENERIDPNELTQSKDYVDVRKTSIAIKILGQIVKNQRDTLEKCKLKELIRESFLVGFRLLAFIGDTLEEAVPELINYVMRRYGYMQIDKQHIEKKIRLHFSSMLYSSCLTIFSQLALCVGTSEINEIFDTVAEDIKSPAAKLVSFTIKTYYGSMNESDLKKIVKEFENNPVALQVVKARVNHYVYNNYLSYEKKQSFGAICKMSIINRQNRH